MIRVALVGAGGMARRYRAVYAKLPGVEFTVAVDPDAEAREACRALGVRRVSADFADALAADVDMLDISTPNHLHEQQAVAALAAGKHVLLQKPMSNSLAAADRIVAAARQSRGVLGMYLFSFTNPMAWEVRKLIEQGLLGRLQGVRARDAHTGGLKLTFWGPANWRSSRDLTGGGSFIQLSTHSINLIQWWLGSRIVEVTAFSGNQHCPAIGGDDVTVAAVRFDNGCFGTFDSGYASSKLTREVYGSDGYIRLMDSDTRLEIELSKPYHGEWLRYNTPGQRAEYPAPRFELDDVENPLNQHRMFVEAIRDGRPPHMSGEQGRQDLAVVMAAYESAATGRAVKVQEPG